MVASPIDYNTLTPFTLHQSLPTTNRFNPSPPATNNSTSSSSTTTNNNNNNNNNNRSIAGRDGSADTNGNNYNAWGQQHVGPSTAHHGHHHHHHHSLLDPHVAAAADDQGGAADKLDNDGKKKNVGGRPRDKVWEFFNASTMSEGGKMLATCKHCGWRTEHPKAFRMRAHAESCTQVSEHDKQRIRLWQDEKESKRQERGTTGNSSTGGKKKARHPHSPHDHIGVDVNGMENDVTGANATVTTNSIQIPHHIEDDNGVTLPDASGQQTRSALTSIVDPDSLTSSNNNNSSSGNKKRRLDFVGSTAPQSHNPTPQHHHPAQHHHDDHMAAVFGHAALVGHHHHHHQQQQPQQQHHGRTHSSHGQMDPTLLGMASLRSPITCHVLDSMSGKPAPGMRVQLDRFVGNSFTFYAQGMTDNDGRCSNLLPPAPTIDIGVYKMTFYTKEYFGTRNISSFYPFVEIPFEVKVADEHYHVPLLLSPYAYSTYRGS
ncbi:hypothetical protein OIO90_004914 [Microbotryomycetes sp. JL221]|nr:hypothetical protein OIO90_004914 [Microbotryomycetes sp. JL221]